MRVQDRPCGDEPGWVCQQVLDATDSDGLAELSDFLVEKPLKILLIALVALVVNRLVRRTVKRFAAGVAGLTGPDSADGRIGRLRRRAPAALLSAGEPSVRSAARAETIGAVMSSLTSVVVYGLALLTILGEVGINLGPLIAGAGIVGVAVGFGAQSLVKDFFSGMFILMEDQYGVGDVIDAGDAVGTVEAVSLRITRIRDVNGTVWHVPNGQILRVGNKSQQWARAVLDVPVAHGTDVRRAQEVIKRVADEMANDDQWRSEILEEPEVWGVENLGPDGVDIRLVVKTTPASKLGVMRALRIGLNDAFDAESIEMPSSQRTLWVRNQGDDHAPAPGTKAGTGEDLAAGPVDGTGVGAVADAPATAPSAGGIRPG